MAPRATGAFGYCPSLPTTDAIVPGHQPRANRTQPLGPALRLPRAPGAGPLSGVQVLCPHPENLGNGARSDTGTYMTRLLQPLFALFAVASDSKLRQMVEYLKAENEILRSKL